MESRSLHVLRTTILVMLGLLYISRCQSQQLVAEMAQAKLATEKDITFAIYDGDNYIYIFGGGTMFSRYDEIERYDIENDSIRIVAAMPTARAAGATSIDRDGNIYYFGGNDFEGRYSEILKYVPATNSITIANRLPSGNIVGSVVTDNFNNAYYFGGIPNRFRMYRFNMTDETLTDIGILPKDCEYSAAFFDGNDTVYIFGNPGSSGGSESVVKLNLLSLESTLEPANFPAISISSSAIFDGKYGYVFGFPGLTDNGTIQFDPATLENKFLPMINYPVGLSGNNAVYVKKLHRIYLFGGRRFTRPVPPPTYSRDIYFIDLI